MINMMPNKGYFITGAGGDKEPSGTKVHYNPGVSLDYLQEMVASQKGDIPSRPVTDSEVETMLNDTWNNQYKRR